MDKNETKHIAKASQHESYGTLSLVTVLLPIVGFILGIVYLTKDKAIDRKLGEHLLAVSVLMAVVFSFLWFMYGNMLFSYGI